MKVLASTPKKDGFRMPGEFEPHEGCWMLWPQRPDNWRLHAKPAQEAFARAAEAISRFEPVTVGASDGQYENARAMLPENIRLVELSSDDSWARDCGATFVTNGRETRGVDWAFNAWGGLVDGLYSSWEKDDRVARKMCEMEKMDRYRLDRFVLEGGSIHVDGEGTVLTTEECLLSTGRNPGLSKADIESVLCEYLNAEKVLWLKRGIFLDETNGHVDNLCCFARPGEVVLAWTDDRNDPQYDISRENYDILSGCTDAKGRKLKIDRLRLPAPVCISAEESTGVTEAAGTHPRKAGDRLAASYVNFYLANGGVVFPLFGDPNDARAEKTLKTIFPGHEVVGIYAREILLGGGNIHCITQQMPARPGGTL